MSYTSTLFGFRIDSHPEYLSLIERYQSIAYPDLGHYLKSQGCEYARLSPMSDQLGEGVANLPTRRRYAGNQRKR
jgi:hypothetical protein